MAEEYGCLADGTPVRDVSQGMLVEFSFPGETLWYFGIVVSVDPLDENTFIPMIRVEMVRNKKVYAVTPNFVKKWKP
jgi:hypothetical protein